MTRDSRVDPRPRCPKCGFLMCEQFDEEGSLMIPNGKYICHHCKREWAKDAMVDLAEEAVEPLLVEVDRLRAAQQWRPIETAPDYDVEAVYWLKHLGKRVIGRRVSDVGVSYNGNGSFEASHWLPIPEAPQ